MGLLVLVTFRTEAGEDTPTRPGATTIKVAAFQWGRRFTFSGRGVTVIGNSNHTPNCAVPVAVWGHHMFVAGGVQNQYYSFTSTLLGLPAGIEYFDLIGTLFGGAIVAAARLPRQRLLLHRRPLPLHAVRRQPLRPARGLPLLVPEGDRGDDAGTAGREGGGHPARDSGARRVARPRATPPG